MNRTRTRKGMLVLELLDRHGEMYGLDIVERSKGEIGRAGLYAGLLTRMEGLGLIGSRQEPEGMVFGQVPRRLYSITENGKISLAASRGLTPTPAPACPNCARLKELLLKCIDSLSASSTCSCCASVRRDLEGGIDGR